MRKQYETEKFVLKMMLGIQSELMYLYEIFKKGIAPSVALGCSFHCSLKLKLGAPKQPTRSPMYEPVCVETKCVRMNAFVCRLMLYNLLQP